MAGCAYTIFDTAVGRCGIAWGESGIIGVQLPEVREIETRRRLFRLYPDARELRPPPGVETAIEFTPTMPDCSASPIMFAVCAEPVNV